MYDSCQCYVLRLCHSEFCARDSTLLDAYYMLKNLTSVQNLEPRCKNPFILQLLISHPSPSVDLYYSLFGNDRCEIKVKDDTIVRVIPKKSGVYREE